MEYRCDVTEEPVPVLLLETNGRQTVAKRNTDEPEDSDLHTDT